MPFINDPERIHELLDREVLANVEQPGQYVNGEINAIYKASAGVDINTALCFPDRYTVGMSHLGYQILYSLVNNLDWACAERAYAPCPDMQAEMRKRGIPLFTLESFRPVRTFDVIGFTLQSELLYSNILAMLDLAGVPLKSSNRRETDPFVIAGGPGALNPEPLADFFDIFFIGDGEANLLPFLTLLRESKAAGKNRDEVLLLCAREAPGGYVPGLYNVEYETNGLVKSVQPCNKNIPVRVRTARVDNLDDAPFPANPVVPLVDTVHDRITLEIMRGCTRGCRFCHAGMTDRPTRYRSSKKLIELALESYRNTGYEEISLVSLSSSDYSDLKPLLEELTEHFDPLNVSISLPSLRVSDQLELLVGPLSSVRKGGLTLAPEAATERLRRIINKDITEEDLLSGLKAAGEEGYRHAKLYFMIGLPGETEDDVREIAGLCQRALGNSNTPGNPGFQKLNVTISPFVPKAHTPFQWEPMASLAELKRKTHMPQNETSDGRIRYKYHDPRQSVLEAVIARGSRQVGQMIRRAWELGAQFDAWDEYFRFELWEKTFAEFGLDVHADAEKSEHPDSPFRRRGENEILPWHHIDCGVRAEFLLSELEKSRQQTFTPDCRTGECQQCGACQGTESTQ
ncbi:MAG: TIGR03960 family B12-binding radical SAM protein [Candidatus Brocadiia bacterium]